MGCSNILHAILFFKQHVCLWHCEEREGLGLQSKWSSTQTVDGWERQKAACAARCTLVDKYLFAFSLVIHSYKNIFFFFTLLLLQYTRTLQKSLFLFYLSNPPSLQKISFAFSLAVALYVHTSYTAFSTSTTSTCRTLVHCKKHICFLFHSLYLCSVHWFATSTTSSDYTEGDKCCSYLRTYTPPLLLLLPSHPTYGYKYCFNRKWFLFLFFIFLLSPFPS